MEIVYDKATGTWSEYEEPYATLDVQTEDDWNRLNFMIENFSKLEKENDELKRLLKLAIESFDYIDEEEFSCTGCHKGWEKCPYNAGEKDCCTEKWKYYDEAMKLIGDEQL